MSDIAKKVVLGAVAALLLAPGCKPDPQYRDPSLSQPSPQSIPQAPSSTESGTGGSGAVQGSSDTLSTPRTSDESSLGSPNDTGGTHQLPRDSAQDDSSMKGTGGSGMEGTDMGGTRENGSGTSGMDSTQSTQPRDSTDSSVNTPSSPPSDTLR